jgi:hypothetical protein
MHVEGNRRVSDLPFEIAFHNILLVVWEYYRWRRSLLFCCILIKGLILDDLFLSIISAISINTALVIIIMNFEQVFRSLSRRKIILLVGLFLSAANWGFSPLIHNYGSQLSSELSNSFVIHQLPFVLTTYSSSFIS